MTQITTGPDGQPRFDGMTVESLPAQFDRYARQYWSSAELVAIFKVAAAALRHLSARDEWQPIETAPRDRDIFAGYFKDGKFKADLTYWNNGHWWQMTQNIPTHWRPLPPPPKGTEP